MNFRPSVIVNLDAYRPKPVGQPQPHFETLEALQEAERLVGLASDDIQGGICNAVSGARKLGGLTDGRTLSFAVRLCLKLMHLRTHPADCTLRLALEEWLYQRGNGNG
ncbi:hypothetical protein [Rhizobium rhizophilum]|uniref:Uncharacterized protein n=1 Tax=Rhizobium rhizophilum TaxID=1850373 RepID=A0ABY2QT73_9HYPH|nr:hypothetical protein [Rhizobium rhizophilum]THV13755.1 hypothetical protein E9677_12670 [Rhizobium rhizophilum]